VPKILLAVDGSENAVRATRKLVESAAWYKEPIGIELVTVHPPLPHVGGFAKAVVSQDMVERYYSEEGGKALAPSRKVLDEAALRYAPHILIGDVAATIVEHARKSGADLIYLGTRGMSAVSQLVLGSVATKVLHLAPIPVVLVR
jgi:nucleotide-binding universal stress UspA family protein